MIPPPIPANEAERQAAVEKYQLLDTMPEENYDNITSIIAGICNVPISLITLLDKDRNFLKSRHGVELSESPRSLSFCGHAITSDEDIMIVPDAREDERFKDNPIVDGMQAIFYAGVPLVDNNGYKLGTLCVYDHEPRQLDDSQVSALKAMSRQVMALFEERYKSFQLQELTDQLQVKNQELNDFAGIVSHDLKAPLSNIIMISELLKEEQNDLNEQSLEYIGYLKDSSKSMSRYIDGMLDFYRSEEIASQNFEDISYVDLIEDIVARTANSKNIVISYQPEQDTTIRSSEMALQQIFSNLIINAIKYNDKEKTIITVNLEQDESQYTFTIKDNGSGISPENIKSIFKLFYVAVQNDRNGHQGTGIGLATVAKLVEHLKGKISVESELGEWTEFKIELPKNKKEVA